MEVAERDRRAYKLAKQHFLSLGIPGLTSDVLEKHLNLTEVKPKRKDIPGIYLRLLESAQNANMRPTVIGGSIGGVKNLEPVLFDFNPVAVLDCFGDNWEKLLDTIEVRLKPTGKIRRTPQSIWPMFCKSVLSGAEFLSQFDSGKDFYAWAESFHKDTRSRPALPMLLGYEIHGFGFALACDFLKELGFVNYGKPDVHIRDIFVALGLCEKKANDYQLFKAVTRLADNCRVTAYDADKLFWLIGSGNFYDDPQIGNSGKIGSQKKTFIEHTRRRLG